MITAKDVFGESDRLLNELNFKIVKEDTSRPWGGFYVIDESQAAEFAKHFSWRKILKH